MHTLLTQPLQHETDVVIARQRAGLIARLLSFDTPEQTRIATAVSEMVRNAFRYAVNGRATFGVDLAERPQRLVVVVADDGPGILDLQAVLDGRYRSTTGLGRGILGVHRLMDQCQVETSPTGTRVVMQKTLPLRAPLLTAERLAHIEETMRKRQPHGALEEVQHQNRELLLALEELQRKQDELLRLNHELEDTNRGVVALYAELDDKATSLRQADEMKSRFLSNMTHEFRTPVNSIIGLCQLMRDARLQEHRDPEPELTFIASAAEELRALVDDLLDLATVQAGKTAVRVTAFSVDTLFSALRGMLRPLLLNQSISLVFDAADGLPVLETDEAKVSQILRNLISNALKFTERGEVRISARTEEDGRTIVFVVSDTGIGIAPDDQARIFEEFTQLEHRLKGTARGTGLGLPLSRRLAEVLGGSITVTSEPGLGSAFTVRLPTRYDLQ